MLESSLEAIYSILILSLGILVIGLVMRRADLGKGTAYVGIATGVMGIVAALSSFFASTLSVTIIIASVLTTMWILLVGFRLIHFSNR